MKTIEDINVKNKNVLIRVDYNVPLKDGKIEGDFRIRASLPTINYLLENGAKRIYLISHLGRPDGKENFDFTLSPVADQLRKLLPNQKIGFYPLPKDGKLDKIPDDVKIVLFENLRFDAGEEENSKSFIKNIVNASNADLFVQDGFGVVHRAHASTDAIKEFLPIYAGLLLKSEVESLTSILKNPARPLVVIIGGAKVEDKQPLIDQFSKISDKILIGGKISADGYKNDNQNVYVAEDFDEDASGNKLDIGPISTAKIVESIEDAKTIIWNGLLGYAEDPAFSTASTIVADAIGEKTDAQTLILGGDTTAFVEDLTKVHPKLKFSLISTGGGAALEFLLGKKLPGLLAIEE